MAGSKRHRRSGETGVPRIGSWLVRLSGADTVATLLTIGLTHFGKLKCQPENPRKQGPAYK